MRWKTEMKITKTRQVTQAYEEEVCDICGKHIWGAKLKARGFGNMGCRYAICSYCWDLFKKLVKGKISFKVEED